MIFSKFFKAKWQHKDENVRLAAVNNELNVTNEADQQTLLLMLKGDSSAKVRLAALKKLNQRKLYWQYLPDSDKTISEYALQQLEKIFLTDIDALSSEEKNIFFNHCKKTSLLENWYKQERDETLQLALFQKLNKPSFFYTAFVYSQSEEIQREVILQSDEVNFLEKCLKKSNNIAISTLINEKLNTIKLAQEKPVLIAKEAQLTLSMLLALKEQGDYEKIIAKRAQLEDKWLNLTNEFTCLSSDEQRTFESKYLNISEQLNKAFASKEEAYQQAQIAKELARQKKAQYHHIESELSRIDQTISNAVFESTNLDEISISQQCEALSLYIAESQITSAEKSQFVSRLIKEQQKLEQIPVIAESVSTATHLVARIAQLSVPQDLAEFNERAPIFKQWKTDWREVQKRSSGVLPESLKSAYKEITTTWHKALKPFEEQQEKLLKQTFRKFSDVKRLIQHGKYNASFGVFKHANELYQQLSENLQAKASRDYEQLSTKIAELSDWEHYVATPRKEELLKEVQAIAATPHEDLSKQASLVKTYRKTWNSLGHAEEDKEQTLNDAFNTACEQAFAPCRAFFAEQESVRQKHCEQRAKVIADITSLSEQLSEDADIKAIEKHYNELKKQWQSAGEVDRKTYQALLGKYRSACKPMNDFINANQHSNAEQKNQLILQANELLNAEDIFTSANEVKQLQQQWKSIGYAGNKQENKLWQKFRKINDTIFSKRDETKQAQQEKNQQAFVEVETRLTTLTEQVANKSTFSELNELAKKVSMLKSDLPMKNARAKPIVSQINQTLETVNDKIEAITNEQHRSHWLMAFSVLSSVIDHGVHVESLDEFKQLPVKWQRKLREAEQSTTVVDRNDATLEIEILAGVESPAQYQQQRLSVQVALMQDQMTSGGKVDLTEQFFEWLSLGKLSQGDKPYIERLQKVYCA